MGAVRDQRRERIERGRGGVQSQRARRERERREHWPYMHMHMHMQERESRQQHCRALLDSACDSASLMVGTPQVCAYTVIQVQTSRAPLHTHEAIRVVL